jgi:hypothetical protein
VTVVAQKFGSIDSYSTEWGEDASPAAMSMMGENLLRQLALRVDLGLLEGTGALDCVGIRNVTGATGRMVPEVTGFMVVGLFRSGANRRSRHVLVQSVIVLAWATTSAVTTAGSGVRSRGSCSRPR